MNTVHLFAGAGGGLYADLILGHNPVLAVENNSHACKILRSRKEEGWWPDLEIWEGDIRGFDPTGYKGRVDCLAAGFPCQDISLAGKGAGLDGAKSSLFWEVMRWIDASKPAWVFLENSAAIRTRGRDRVLGSLMERGFLVRDGILSASQVGAWHQRRRWWCLAHLDGAWKLQSQGGLEEQRNRPGNSVKILANIESKGLEEGGVRPEVPRIVQDAGWASEPNVVRMVHGVADGINRIKCLGEGQVPLCAAAAWCFLGGSC